MAIDWRRRRPMLGNVLGGLSGPAIKPIALRAVYQAAQAVKTPIIGIGGIATIDDVMEFLVAGASAVQLGTVNFYNPKASMEVLDALPGALAERWSESRRRRRRNVDDEPESIAAMRDAGAQGAHLQCRVPATSCIRDPQSRIIQCAFSAASNRPARSTGATTSARSASTLPCRTTSRRFTSSPTCTR